MRVCKRRPKKDNSTRRVIRSVIFWRHIGRFIRRWLCTVSKQVSKYIYMQCLKVTVTKRWWLEELNNTFSVSGKRCPQTKSNEWVTHINDKFLHDCWCRIRFSFSCASAVFTCHWDYYVFAGVIIFVFFLCFMSTFSCRLEVCLSVWPTRGIDCLEIFLRSDLWFVEYGEEENFVHSLTNFQILYCGC